ncbi:hypothetical protein PVL29_022986 [Vitis rotundifolia]|uniref:Uncharacterized protein n=1 Tax=Vitis rotundifolia TaxID=103349 RepID=A0AA39DBR7_VITRO|nr:hypothetical protein PVL29_022986 [Vitis rotundifolia]
MSCNAKEDDFCELLLHSFPNQVVENKELRVGLEILGMALSLLVVDFCDSHLREAMKWGEEAAMVVGSNMERVKRRRVIKTIKAQMEMMDCALVKMLKLKRTEEILLVVDNGVVFREEDQKKTHTPAFATALPWRRHPSLSFYP